MKNSFTQRGFMRSKPTLIMRKQFDADINKTLNAAFLVAGKEIFIRAMTAYTIRVELLI